MKTPTTLIALLALCLPVLPVQAEDKPGQVVAYASVAAASSAAPAAAPAAAATAATAVAAPVAPPGWEIKTGDQTVRTALERWAAAAGWQLSWGVKVDYPVEADAVVSGTFEQAVEAVVTSLERSQVPLKATFYQGNKVLRVAAKGGK